MTRAGAEAAILRSARGLLRSSISSALLKGYSRFIEPIGRPMTSSDDSFAPYSRLILSRNRFGNYAFVVFGIIQH